MGSDQILHLGRFPYRVVVSGSVVKIYAVHSRVELISTAKIESLPSLLDYLSRW